MIAKRKLTDADDGVEKHDIVPHTAGQGNWWHVIPAGMTPGAQSFLAKRACLGKQGFRVPRRIVGAQYTHDAGNPGTRKLSKRHWRYARAESRLTTAAGHMRMAVDEAGYDAPPLEIELGGIARLKLGLVAADGNDPAATDQNMTETQILGREDLGVG